MRGRISKAGFLRPPKIHMKVVHRTLLKVYSTWTYSIFLRK
jgi:hypothetical protein